MWKKFLKYAKENPKILGEMKSAKMFTQTFGGISGGYVVIAEYDSLADYEKANAKFRKAEGGQKIMQEFMSHIIPHTISVQCGAQSIKPET